MITKIEQGDILYALHAPFNDINKVGTEWFGKEIFPLQGSRMCYNAGKVFRTHRHVLNPRIINRTQEAFIVIEGSLQIDIYDDKPNNGIIMFDINNKTVYHLGRLIANKGDAIFVWAGFHKLSILKDNTCAYEIKSGQFTTVSEDKEFLDV